MKKKKIAILVLLACILGIAFLCYLSYRTDIAVPYLSNLEKVRGDIFTLINRERMSRNLPALLRDEALDFMALEWSNFLAKNNIVSHGNFDERISQIGYTNYLCGEIIAKRGGWTTSLATDLIDM